jgi:hypothetical protein
VQHEHAQGAIELIVVEGNCAGVALPGRNSRVGISLPQRIDELLFIINALDSRDIRAFRNKKRQASGAAPDIYDALAVRNPGEVQE